ncbi:hypothetical protein OG394_12450 [Kribbella sp. NBC_01245]|uniref:hypothetical protein n=1 Tax=Kribbella sp. NBC_01245 TaxID=2903578 RepID=UPI002E27AFFC|nr:hypothetical protein [Kribbella sp. NBC_01245]
MSIARVVLGVLLVCALSGCTGGKEDKPDGGPLPDLPAVVHPKAEVPKDRDPAAVAAALTRLDACALMGSAKAVPMTPHRCRLETGVGESMTLTLGTPLTWQERYGSDLQTVKGARVYFQGPDLDRCKADIPVSFTHTIEVGLTTLRDPTPATCKRVRTMTEAVITRLANPEANLARMPAARWNACTALARSLGLTAPTSKHDFANGLDGCTDPDGLQVELSFGRDFKPSSDATVRQLGGKRVRQYTYSGCDLEWSQGPSGVATAPKRVVTVRAKTCAQADKSALVLMKVLDGPPPAQAKPQHPLIYKSGEPDRAAAGACADVGTLEPCEPYHQVEAPTGAQEVLRRVKADPNVNCAIAVDAVRKHLGPGFRPATLNSSAKYLAHRSCEFVEQSHGQSFAVSVVDAPPTPKTVYVPHGKEVTVQGRPGTHFSFVEPKSRRDDLYVEVADRITLRLQFGLGLPRGVTSKTALDSERAAVLQPLAIDILNKHFS